MTKLHDVPCVFVHYPTGAGGWFFSSLLYYCFDNTEPLLFDQVGSGHANRSISYTTNFYKNFLQEDQGLDIIYDRNYENFSHEERIKYIRSKLLVAPDSNISTHVISIHCKNINVFLEALPLLKVVQINIEEKDLLKCTYNYLFKVLSQTPINFYTFCEERGITGDELEIARQKIQNLNKENMEYFRWVVPFIEETNQTISNDDRFLNRIYEISYTEYMSMDIEIMMRQILDFVECQYDQGLFEQACGHVLSYRMTQPTFPE
jgi:hypothetical protein